MSLDKALSRLYAQQNNNQAGNILACGFVVNENENQAKQERALKTYTVQWLKTFV